MRVFNEHSLKVILVLVNILNNYQIEGLSRVYHNVRKRTLHEYDKKRPRGFSCFEHIPSIRSFSVKSYQLCSLNIQDIEEMSKVTLSSLEISPDNVLIPDVTTDGNVRWNVSTSAIASVNTHSQNMTKNILSNAWDNLPPPEIIAILTIYFVQGAIGLSRLAVSFYMKDELHISPAELATIQGINGLPWVIKPLYGFISDVFPILGYRRRSYLILAGLVGCISWISLASFTHSPLSAIIATTLASGSIAVSDVVADSLAVERSRPQSHGNIVSSIAQNTIIKKKEYDSGELQSMCWSAAAFGGVLSAYFSGSLLQYTSMYNVFYITALFPLLISISSFFIDETPTSLSSTDSVAKSVVKEQVATLFNVIKNPSIYLPVLFIFLWQATPSADTAMFFFSTNVLHFSPEFLGQVRLIGSLASLVGVFAFRNYFKTTPIKQLILYTTLVSVLLSMTQIMLTTRYNLQLGIPDQLFALTETSVLSVLGQLAFMPTLVLAAMLCPPGVEGTLFATLMSIYNAAGSLSSGTGAWLTSWLGVSDTNFDNLSLLIFITSVSNLLPLLFIGNLDEVNVTHSSDKNS